MGNDSLQAAKLTASAFEFLLVLFLLPQAISRRPEKDDPDYMLRILLGVSLLKSAADIVCFLLPGTIPSAVYAVVSGALEIAASTIWYCFIVTYLWNSWHTTANGLRLSLLWLAIWLAIAAIGLTKGALQSELDGMAGGNWLIHALCWLTIVPLALAEILLIGKHENLQARDVAVLALFPLPAVVGLILSYLQPPLLWNSPGLSLMLLVVSLYLQNRTTQRDPLTGAHTRSWFKAQLTERLKDAKASPFMLMMLDLDNFKKINDMWGHLEGDRALVTVVELLKKSLRNSDVIARFAGDEFLVLANLTNSDEGAIIQRRVKEQLMEYNLASGKPYTLGWSTGTVYCDKPRNPDELLASVDEHMYKAKKEGRR